MPAGSANRTGGARWLFNKSVTDIQPVDDRFRIAYPERDFNLIEDLRESTDVAVTSKNSRSPPAPRLFFFLPSKVEHGSAWPVPIKLSAY